MVRHGTTGIDPKGIEMGRHYPRRGRRAVHPIARRVPVPVDCRRISPALANARLGYAEFCAGVEARAGGQRSTVRTRFVSMELDHDTGEMDGDILEGPYAGRRLSDLDVDSLLDLLHAAASADAQSAQVLQSYLDRMHGDEWRERAGDSADATDEAGAAASSGRMSREEAFEILGLEVGASDEDIKLAHRRLIREYHPDRGGSDYLAAKINEAKDLLLKD